ncbi:EAL domain-containing protein (putative c-di-GMP-specific phosphodiesterase class I) [Herminiimonas fonticola]|uniref:EAL domain-containing protein (Putative c-di-GMP-specific phosphodiesterase class I) n=2 Tax=Herminiimonas fonticola TaxID=303380 RepID=A0A4V3BV61_9BURK|nr:EAL domain [Herminiimonas fonticola]TDN89468.1 EAL domain-containing protein (putative c-di-GMP-specific phosphodiesterase class I) [Herminiimonas fonticola]
MEMTANLNSKQSLRMRRALLLSSLVLGVISLFWGAYFVSNGNWTMFPINLISVIVAIGVTWITLRGHIRTASIIMFCYVYAVLCVFCVLLDVPTLEAPRSNHNYFLVIALFAWLVFKGDKPWLRHGMTLAGLLGFILFSSTTWGLHTAYALGNDVRVAGTWIHNIIATGLLWTLLWVMQANLSERSVMESDLRKAIRENQLVLYYQPQTGDDGRIVGAEALLRWQHPIKGMVSPADFIPLAEQTGLIMPVGHWVLGTACAQLMAWEKNPATAHLSLAVNVSALQFKQTDYVSQVISVLDRSNINPALLTLELTESMLVNDVNDIISKMNALKAKGVRLSLDDFGTGYSSLNYLKKLPLDQLKIDQSFVRDMLNDTHDVTIVRTVIELAHGMKLHVIAEGVETEEHRQFLADLGCHSFQGYLLSRPVPIADFEVVVLPHNAKVDAAAKTARSALRIAKL